MAAETFYTASRQPLMTIRVAACQVPDIREDLDNALLLIEMFAVRTAREGVSIICFPECFLQGYLTEKEQARRHALDLTSPAFAIILRRLASVEPMLVFGLIELDDTRLFNTAVIVDHGRLVGTYRKTHLLAGETIFEAGDSYPVFEVDGLTFGINICYDTQFAEAATRLAAQGASVILCPSNNMMSREKAEKWKYLHNETRAVRARETGLWLISSDVTGEQGDRVALGPTSVIDPEGKVVAQVPLMEVGMVIAEIPLGSY